MILVNINSLLIQGTMQIRAIVHGQGWSKMILSWDWRFQ